MNPASDKFLADIGNHDVEVRYAAWRAAGSEDPEVIAPLGKLMGADDPGVRNAATQALKTIVDSVGKQPVGEKRAAVIQQFIALTANGHPAWVRTIALRDLSLIGGDETVPAAAKLLTDADLQEEAVFCLERIPGDASIAALIAAYPHVGDSFKPRVLAAFGHRRAAQAVDLCVAAMASSNLDIAIAGMKAAGRIGIKPSGEIKLPDYKSLSDWQKTEYDDSLLRYADSVHDIHIYRAFLERPEEHLQCAAIIGLAKIHTPEAVSLISPKLKSPNRTVRITAQKALA
ncbi:MAG: hypothetical protein ABI165_20640 [Bryobacteraceae bacterium]